MPSLTMITRLVTRGKPPADLKNAQRMLLKLFEDKWPQRFRSKFLLLPGGFLSVDWPPKWTGRFGWDSRVTDADLLVEHAAEAVAQVLNDHVLARIDRRVDIIAIGVDLARDKATNAYAELVALYDINTQAVTFTGKSLGCGSFMTRLDGRSFDHLTSVSFGRDGGSGFGTSPAA